MKRLLMLVSLLMAAPLMGNAAQPVTATVLNNAPNTIQGLEVYVGSYVVDFYFKQPTPKETATRKNLKLKNGQRFTHQSNTKGCGTMMIHTAELCITDGRSVDCLEGFNVDYPKVQNECLLHSEFTIDINAPRSSMENYFSLSKEERNAILSDMVEFNAASERSFDAHDVDDEGLRIFESLDDSNIGEYIEFETIRTAWGNVGYSFDLFITNGKHFFFAVLNNLPITPIPNVVSKVECLYDHVNLLGIKLPSSIAQTPAKFELRPGGNRFELATKELACTVGFNCNITVMYQDPKMGNPTKVLGPIIVTQDMFEDALAEEAIKNGVPVEDTWPSCMISTEYPIRAN